MSCFHPLTAYRAPPGKQIVGTNSSGISFDVRCASMPGIEVLKLPCGQCIGCRLEKSRQWAMRIVLEQQMCAESCFVTLTYNDDNLPKNRSLQLEDMTLFIKRLRKFCDSRGKKIRYFYCGEYGSMTERPHYHMCLFGEDFSDIRSLYRRSKCGDFLYVCGELEKLWQKGFCPFGTLTFDSAAYTARYILKKLNGDIADEHYQGRKPEYICMSRRPGIGASWFDKYKDDVYPKDYIRLRDGIKLRPPKYFDRIYKDMHSQDDFDSPEVQRFLAMKKKRKDKVNSLSDSDLLAREKYTKHLTTQFERSRFVCGLQ